MKEAKFSTMNWWSMCT